MTVGLRLVPATRQSLGDIAVRDGETKVAERVYLLEQGVEAAKSLPEALAAAVESGARFALLGVPEDIGPRANLGRGGAAQAWFAFRQYFLNMQSNRFVNGADFLLVGEIDLDDLMVSATGASPEQLRRLCAEVDARVAPVVEQIVGAGLEPIVIGGGNNNSFPTIQGVVQALRIKLNKPDVKIATVNCDPHADFRALEGRHSGNPFSYADSAGLLDRYCVLGAHENYNSESMLRRLNDRGYPLFFWEDVVRGDDSWEQQIQRVIDYLHGAGSPVGLELDLDGVAMMPSSARTPFGISEEQALAYLYRVASTLNCEYLHLSEGAPAQSEDGTRSVGKFLAKCVAEYGRARQRFMSRNAAAG